MTEENEGRAGEGKHGVQSLEIGMGNVALKVFTMISTFGTALDVTADELRVETFFPADEFSAQFFRTLAQNTAVA